MFLKEFCCAGGERIVAVGDHVTIIGGTDRFDDLGMGAGVVVTSEAAFGHNVSRVLRG